MGETCDTWRGKDMLLLLVCSIAGTEGAPGSVVEGPDGATWNHTAILAHPFSGQHYLYTDTDYPVLTKVQGEDILLTLPPRIQVSDIKWISVWCKAFAIDFGSVMFPEDLLVESEVEETTTKDEIDNEELDESGIANPMENGDGDLDEEVENYEEDDLDDEVENHEEDTFIGMNIISSVQNAIETIQGWLSFV